MLSSKQSRALMQLSFWKDFLSFFFHKFFFMFFSGSKTGKLFQLKTLKYFSPVCLIFYSFNLLNLKLLNPVLLLLKWQRGEHDTLYKQFFFVSFFVSLFFCFFVSLLLCFSLSLFLFFCLSVFLSVFFLFLF